MPENQSSTESVEYREIPGTNGIYRAGTDGTIWSRWDHKRLSDTWKLLVGSHHPSKGYRGVYISTSQTCRLRWVHQLILETFVGPRPPNMECRHLNGNPADNRLDNLCWGTYQENRQDMKRHGRKTGTGPGEISPLSVLTDAIVLFARSEAARGIPTKITAKRVGVEYSTLLQAVTGRNWSHLPNAIRVGKGRKGISRHEVARLVAELDKTPMLL